MLDTFIIERIRQERERVRDGGLKPLRIEPPPPPRHEDELREQPEPTEKRGSVIIDFTL